MFGMLVSLLVLLSLVYLAYAAVSEVYVAVRVRHMEKEVVNHLYRGRSDTAASENG